MPSKLDIIDKKYDIIIVGAGLSGLALVNALQNSDFSDSSNILKIAIIEGKKLNKSKGLNFAQHLESRYIAISLKTQQILDKLGIWSNLRAYSTLITKIEVSDQGGFGKTYLSAAEQKLPALGYNLLITALGGALVNNIINNNIINNNIKVSIYDQCEVCDLECDNKLIINQNNKKTELIGKFIIAADGANSKVRSLLGVKAKRKDYQQTAIVTTVGLKRDHDSQAYERFTKYGPLALVPCVINDPNDLNNLDNTHNTNNYNNMRSMSLVWCVSPEMAGSLLKSSKADFLNKLQSVFGYNCGKFIDCGKLISYPIYRTLSEQAYKNNVLFLGNAAHSIHPVAGQGFNLTISEIMPLAQLITDGLNQDNSYFKNPDNIEILINLFLDKIIQKQNQVINLTDDLIQVFSNDLPGVKLARRFLLNRVDNLSLVKKKLNLVMMGLD